MNPTITTSSIMVANASLNKRLDDIMKRLNFSRFDRMYIAFDRNIPTKLEYGLNYYHLVSTIGYCIMTPKKTLILTYETEFAIGEFWSGLCIRDLGNNKSIDLTNESNIDWNKLKKSISRVYDEYCRLL